MIIWFTRWRDKKRLLSSPEVWRNRNAVPTLTRQYPKFHFLVYSWCWCKTLDYCNPFWNNPDRDRACGFDIRSLPHHPWDMVVAIIISSLPSAPGSTTPSSHIWWIGFRAYYNRYTRVESLTDEAIYPSRAWVCRHTANPPAERTWTSYCRNWWGAWTVHNAAGHERIFS